jgi:hypothetical protein
MAWSALAVSLVLLSADPSEAPSGDAASKADALVKQGVEFRRQGKDDEALKVFEEAQHIAPSPRGLGQLGLAEQATGRWVEAERDMKAALLEGNDPWVSKNQAVLQGALAEVAKHVGTLRLKGSPEGATVYIDEKAVGVLPLEQRVTAGELWVRVAADGYAPLAKKVTMDGGKLVVERFDLLALKRAGNAAVAAPANQRATVLVAPASGQDETPVTPPLDERTPLYKRPAAWIVGGALVVLLGVTLGLTVGRQDTYPTPSLGSRQY